MDLNKIGKIIKKYRTSLGLTSAEAAEKLEVSRPYYSRLENGKEKPALHLINKLESKFELSVPDVLDLMRYSGNAENPSPADSNMGQIQLAEGVPEGESVQINPQEQKVLFSDTMFITVNDNGVVFDFGQKLGPTEQTFVVSRIGVSKTHAEKIHNLLGQQLNKSKDVSIDG